MQTPNSKQFRLGAGRIGGYLPLSLGGLSLFAVICFLSPEFLTTPDVRQAFPIALFRQILFFTLLLAFAFGLLTDLAQYSIKTLFCK